MSQWVPADFPVQQLELYVCRMFYSTSIVFAIIRATLLISLYSSDLSQQKLIIFFLVLNFSTCIVGLLTLRRSTRFRNVIKYIYSESLNSYFLYQAFWLVPEYKLELTISSFAVIGSFYQIAFNQGACTSVILTVKQLFMWISMDILSSQLSQKKFSTFMVVFYIAGAYAMLFHIYLTLSRTRTHLVDQITEKTKQVTTVLESIQDGMIVMKGREVMMFNKSITRMFGCETNKQVLQQLAQVDDLLRLVDIFLKTGSCEHTSFGIYPQRSMNLEWLGSKVTWDQQLAVILTCRDVTELLRLQDLAHKENERKLALMRSISHELRTPMNFVKEIAEETMANGGRCDPETMKVFCSCCNLMDLLVDEIQDFAQVTSDSFELNDEPVSLSTLLEKCLDMVKPYASSKHLSLTLSCDPEMPSSIDTDASRLSQLLINLLSNAVKYTNNGSVRLIAVATVQDKIKLIVEDTGIGIDPHRIPALFDCSSEKFLPTCGLGLFMANQLAIILGGVPISVTSKVAHGSSFSFLVRRKPVLQRRLSQSKSLTAYLTESVDEEQESHQIMPVFTTGQFLQERISIRVPDVLIVDDYPFNRMVLRTWLEKEGIFTQEAENGTEAISLIQRLEYQGRHYRLIIMDFDMPILDGISTTKELRRMQRTDSDLVLPPIIGHSAYTSDEDRRRCLEAGMDSFLPKPCNKSEALALICKMILPRDR